MTTSSDGILTATTDPTTASIKLTVDFTGYAGGIPAPTVNLIPNPSDEAVVGMSAEANTSVARSTAQKYIGAASTALTCTTAGTVAANCGAGTAGIPVSPGITYTVSVYVRAGTTGRIATVLIDWYNAAGGYVSSSVGTGSADSTTWGRRTATGACPATGAFATTKVTFNSAALAEIHYVDARQLEATSAATAYCDGAQAGCYWTGAADASVSRRPAYTQLTVRRADGTIVRGLDNAVAPGGIGKGYDHEAPLGSAVVYSASLSNGYGTLSSLTASATITAPSGSIWLKHLRTPAISVSAVVRDLPTIENDIPTGILSVLGARFPAAQGDAEKGDTGTISILTDTAAKRQALSALLTAGGAGPYLMQMPSAWDEPDRYVMILNRSRARLTRPGADPYRITSLPFVQVARPATTGSTVTIPGKSYADSTAALPLYSNRTGTYGSRS